jgi:hypothetical protein
MKYGSTEKPLLVVLLLVTSFLAGLFFSQTTAAQCTGDPLRCTTRNGAVILYAACGYNNCLPNRCQTIRYRCSWDATQYTSRFCVAEQDCITSVCADCDPL